MIRKGESNFAVTVACISALAVASCGEDKKPAARSQPASSDQLPAIANPDARSCIGGPVVAPARVGAFIRYASINKDGEKRRFTISEKIVGIQNDRITARNTLYLGSVETNAAMRTRVGPLLEATNTQLSPSGSPNAETARSYLYPDDAAAAVMRLAPGQSVTLEASERTAFDGKPRVVRGTVTVEFLGCRSINLQGVAEFTRVYRVTSFGRSYSAKEKLDTVVTPVSIIDISPRLGWWVREQGESGGFTQAVELTQ